MISQLQAELANDHQTLEVVLIDRDSSGVAQIGQYLSASEHEFDSVHLVTHGGSGQFQLGSDWLNVNTLDQFQQQLLLWQDGLTNDADVMIYGCQVASTLDGQDLALKLAQALDADVAMSVDSTGQLTLGGDWIWSFKLDRLVPIARW